MEEKSQSSTENAVFSEREKRVLLHCCCAPCAGEIIQAVLADGLQPTVFFYNPNIHPKSEYLYRKHEVKRYVEKQNIPFVDADYDASFWLKQIAGLAQEEEGGARCRVCFYIRLNRTAQYAHANHFSVFASTLGISRWKNFEEITQIGTDCAREFPHLTYWDRNWRKKGGAERMYEIAKQEKFYQQEYCGCAFSLRDANRMRQAQGKSLIVLGQKRYQEAEL